MLPRAGIVRVVLMDQAGREMGVLASGLSSSGENLLEIDVSTIPAGEYRCVMQTRDGNASATLTITR